MTATMDSADLHREEIRRLRAELKARNAEVAWIKAHYGQHLQEAFATIDALRAASQPQRELPAIPAPVIAPVTTDDTRVARLEADVERLLLAERRYLDRIEELKDSLAAKRPAKSEAS